jgi:SulP family sulfate permease
VSLLVNAKVSQLAVSPSEDYIKITLTLTGLVGVVSVILALLKAGSVIRTLVSVPVAVGFTTGISVMIILGQVPNLINIHGPKSEPDLIIPVLENLIKHGGDWNPYAFAIGLVGLFVMMAWKVAEVKATNPIVKKILHIPFALLFYFVFATLFSFLYNWEETLGIKVIGPLTPGFGPRYFSLDSWYSITDFSSRGTGEEAGSLNNLIGIALAISAIGFIESVAVADVYATKYGYLLNKDQEFFALGMVNIISCFTPSFPVSGSLASTPVNVECGGRTLVSTLPACLVLIVSVLYAEPLFYHTPEAVLSSIVMFSVMSIFDVHEIYHVFLLSKADFVVCLATFLVVIFLGPIVGIAVGVGLAVFMVVGVALFPSAHRMGLVEYDLNESSSGITWLVTHDDHHSGQHNTAYTYVPLEFRPDALVPSGIEIFRYESAIYFGNKSHFEEKVKLLAFPDKVHTIVLDFSCVPRVDVSAIDMLQNLHEALSQFKTKKTVYFANVNKSVYTLFAKSHLLELYEQECKPCFEDPIQHAIYHAQNSLSHIIAHGLKSKPGTISVTSEAGLTRHLKMTDATNAPYSSASLAKLSSRGLANGSNCSSANRSPSSISLTREVEIVSA